MFSSPILDSLITAYWKFIQAWGNILFFHPKNKEAWNKYLNAIILRCDNYKEYDVPINKIIAVLGIWAFIDYIFAIIKAVLMGGCICYLLLIW